MSTDFRALCAELAAELDHNRRCLLDDASLTHPLADRARVALAEPADGPAVPEGREPASVAEQPSDDALGLIYHDCCRGCEFMDQVGFEDAARAVLARWGRPAQPAPPAEGEIDQLVSQLYDYAQGEAENGWHDDAARFRRAAELLAQAHSTPPAPVPVPVAEPVAEPPAVAERPSDEELLRIAATKIEPYDLIEVGEYEAEKNCALEVYGSELCAFARDVLARWGHAAPVPVPVSERLPGREDCDAEGRCWLYRPQTPILNPSWDLARLECDDPVPPTHWLPAHTLPLPAPQGGEVEP